ncbi:cilia- and flagella-associated protein 251-like isoform X3 [Salvelinus alpinus]|uniref:cilia- and flagella-associated protein 251-like isoform X3 n=1 Tax=Salvelinus alpinus TaxID=8036 RepID=UPI0039FDD272
MSSLNYSPLVKEEVICWTEKEALGLNIVVKEEKEEEDITVKQEVEGEAVTVKEEEKDVTVKEEEDAFRVKEEEDVTVKEEEEEKEVEDVTVKEEEDVKEVTVKEEEDVTVKEEEEEKEEDAVFGVKEEEGEITVTLEEEEEVGDPFNPSFLSSDKERYESQSTYEEVPMKSSGSQSWGLKEAHCCFCLSTAQLIQMINSSSSFKWYLCIHL